MKNPRGVTLIMVAAVLSILAAMATGFYTLMLMQTKSAVRYADTVRADMVAKAGIHYGVAQLRAQAFKKTEDASNAWYQADYLRGASKRVSFPDSPLLHDGIDDDVPSDNEVDNPEEALVDPAQTRSYSVALSASAGKDSDRFALNIADAAGKINVNAGDNLAVMLDNLCRVIGPPLVPANLEAIQPRRWGVEMDAGDPAKPLYETALNTNDTAANRDIYYTFTNEGGTVMTDGTGRPRRGPDGVAIYGDGYAIAGYRARHGAYRNLEDIKEALTYVERNGTPKSVPDDPMEQLEVEVKFAAIRDHITTGSWVDTNTVCVGKFEWVHIDTGTAPKTYAIDRDKSWVIDDPVGDPLNLRGSLRGCYLSIMNGHGAGQLRRIRSNGIDWLEVEPPKAGDPAFAVTPGPISSYMIVSNEEALLMDVNGAQSTYSYPDKPPPPGTLTFPMTKSDGTLVPNPKIDYSLHPLCIHRAPVNVNTATDKVLVALLLGINVQHGHPLALGTDADVEELRDKWKKADIHRVQPYILKPEGLKRIPAASGKVVLNRSWGAGKNQVPPPPPVYDVAYLNNHGNLGAPNFFVPPKTTATMTEAHELAYRIIVARQSDRLQPGLKYIDPKTGGPTATNTGLLRGPFRIWEDLYFRVIKPWDDVRLKGGWIDTNGDGLTDPGDEYHAARLANMLMANFNSNTDILKFNPNIEWIDRWSRNFTEQEPVMVYTDANPPADGIFTVDVAAADPITAYSIPIYTSVFDPNAGGFWGKGVPPIRSSQRDDDGKLILGAYLTRSFRYKSDEMIDKSDLNRSTTELSFDSNGIFEIVSTGQVVNRGEVLAERKFAALVKVYDVWRESTQQQFVQGTISKAFGDRGSTCSGQLARDASGLVERKGLVTLPEPLLPLQARIVDANGARNPRNKEAVSGIISGNSDPLDAFGNARQNPYDKGASPIEVPEVLANRILPARYDGQIALATNTSAYDPSTGGDADTFLASFDGDLDTATCQGNGREQAKWPYSAEPDGSGGFRYTGNGYKHRCVQSIGLLGLLNDTLIASDPGIPLIDGTTPMPPPPFPASAADRGRIRWIYPFFGMTGALRPLTLGSDPERPAYWNNVTLRMGSLRTDGAYLSAPGVSGNNATLKYLFTPDKTDRHKKLNFQPDSTDGNCITMWTKTAWHHDDMRNHEFFNPGNAARANQCVRFNFEKSGQYKWASRDEQTGGGFCGNRRELNDLLTVMFCMADSGYGSALHGGFVGVNRNTSPDESPGYRIQAFRWSYLGIRGHYTTTATCPPNVDSWPCGHLISSDDWRNIKHDAIARSYVRPFVDTALFPEVPANWAASDSPGIRLRWSYRGCTDWNSLSQTSTYGDARDVIGGPTSVAQPNPTEGGRCGEGQDVKWAWADPYGKIAPDAAVPSSSLKCFGMNNLNYGNPSYNQTFDENNPEGSCALFWHFRHMPEDGTYAVIDEFKISNKDRVLVDGAPDWNKDRVTRTDPALPGEMSLSRYYLPPKPGTRQSPSAGGPPTFTSQTLLQSLKGFDKLKDTQNIAVVRLSWNVFTPRFMCEYKTSGMAAFVRDENLTHYADATAAQAKVPVQIKGPFDYVKYNDDKYNDDPTLDPKWANQPNRYYSVSRPAPWEYKAGLAQPGRGVELELLQDQGATSKVLGGKTFTDPAAVNSLGTPDDPVWVYASQLRYRVRFCYPVDPLVDPGGGPSVDLEKQYLLDTPIFDDISVTYILPPRILEFRELME